MSFWTGLTQKIRCLEKASGNLGLIEASDLGCREYLFGVYFVVVLACKMFLK